MVLLLLLLLLSLFVDVDVHVVVVAAAAVDPVDVVVVTVAVPDFLRLTFSKYPFEVVNNSELAPSKSFNVLLTFFSVKAFLVVVVAFVAVVAVALVSVVALPLWLLFHLTFDIE